MLYNRQKKVRLSPESRKLIQSAVKLAEKSAAFPHSTEVTITLTDNEAISDLNKTHRGIDAATDVLSFPLISYEEGKPDIQAADVNPETGKVSLGDIVISVEKAVEQAEAYGHSFERELAFLAVHGMLHLLGHDHETEPEEAAMLQKQEAVLTELGLKRND